MLNATLLSCPHTAQLNISLANLDPRWHCERSYTHKTAGGRWVVHWPHHPVLLHEGGPFSNSVPALLHKAGAVPTVLRRLLCRVELFFLDTSPFIQRYYNLSVVDQNEQEGGANDYSDISWRQCRGKRWCHAWVSPSAAVAERRMCITRRLRPCTCIGWGCRWL